MKTKFILSSFLAVALMLINFSISENQSLLLTANASSGSGSSGGSGWSSIISSILSSGISDIDLGKPSYSGRMDCGWETYRIEKQTTYVDPETNQTVYGWADMGTRTVYCGKPLNLGPNERKVLLDSKSITEPSYKDCEGWIGLCRPGTMKCEDWGHSCN